MIKPMRVFVAQLNPILGDLENNTQKVIDALKRAREVGAEIVLFSELTICGYPPEDLLLFPHFIEENEKMLHRIIEETKDLFVAVGLPRYNPDQKEKNLYNSAAVIYDQKLLGYKDKTLLPTYDVFDERRYFEPGKEQRVFEFKGQKIAILICEDMWQHGGGVMPTKYNRDPIRELEKLKPDLLLNLSASPFYFQKKDFRQEVFSPCCKTLGCPIIWCNQVGANDSLVFDGYSLYMDAKGELIQSAKGFEEDDLIVDLPQSPNGSFSYDPYYDLYHALVLGVRDYFYKQGFKKALVGASGGIDSSLVLCIASEALGAENVHAVCMPSMYSSAASEEDALQLVKNLGIKNLKIPIDPLFQQYLEILAPYFENKPADITEENLQARIRGSLLMALSNKWGSIVLAPGNKSEFSVGYCTLYGDMCGGLSVISDVKKTQIYELCRWLNEKKQIIPENVLRKAPSAELRPNQKDSDTLPDYAIVDTVLEEYVENHLSAAEILKKHDIDEKTVLSLIHKVHTAEYKRRQAAPGIRVSKKSFSKGRNFPIVQKWR